MTTINLSQLTDTNITGDGVFDVLMRSMKGHLQEEFNKNRITGPEYAKVYLGSLEAVLNASLQFLLTKEKAGLEADLIREQINLTEQEILKAIEQTKLIEQQATNAVTEGLVLAAQECKLKAEFDVLVATKTKTDQEVVLLAQKTNTEKAQTQALGVDDNSIIGRQKLLYKAQADGFVRDAEQKAAKIMVDSWNVRRTTDEGTVADGTNKLSDTYVGQAVQALLSGVGA